MGAVYEATLRRSHDCSLAHLRTPLSSFMGLYETQGLTFVFPPLRLPCPTQLRHGGGQDPKGDCTGVQFNCQSAQLFSYFMSSGIETFSLFL